MEKLQTFLQEGNGIVVANETQFNDLVNECFKIGLAWRCNPQVFESHWDTICVSLLDGWLVHHEPKYEKADMLLMKWDVFKWSSHSKFKFTY